MDASRITQNPSQRGGKPCIRGTRIRVSDVLDLDAPGPSPDQILAKVPDLEPKDLQAALTDAVRQIDHPVLVAGFSAWTLSCHQPWRVGQVEMA
jgi:uncharacterized protein (DUF433 family)